MTVVKIRQLTEDDYKVYRTLRLNGLKEEPAVFEDTYEKAVRRREFFWAADFVDPNCTYFGAFASQELVGSVRLSRHRGARYEHKATLLGMYVEQKERRKGIGSQLVSALEDFARSCSITIIQLTTLAEMPRTIRFYETCGFQQFGLERRGYRIDNGFADVVHMAKSLDTAHLSPNRHSRESGNPT